MGLKSGSSQPSSVSKKASGKTKIRNPTRKTYMSKTQNKEPTNVPSYGNITDEEEINDEDSLVKSPHVDVPDVETYVSLETSNQENPEKDSTFHEDSGNATQPDVSVSSSSKDADPKDDNYEETNSEEPIQAPAPVQDISDDDSDDVPLTASLPDSVAARMKRKRRVPNTETTPTPQKRSKSSPAKGCQDP
ncbi:chromatin modification-related protein EAF7-like [Lotus japonicus]|uniref:chromatin modification-related protein EAF7-like n=1 Tax=Lotus japonicus TaxID=34305 RepID=UPI00258CA955|nr:chromatin modification-related protein EAF7-like [Lotus japonicus]